MSVKTCKCGHDKTVHKPFPFKHCKECPCIRYFHNKRPNIFDHIMMSWMGISAGILLGLAIWFTLEIPTMDEMFEKSTYILGGLLLWVMAGGYLLYIVETVHLPFISQLLRKDYSLKD